MEEIRLDVQIRENVGKKGTKEARREDFIPAVVYGQNQDTVSIKLDRRAFQRIMRLHQGESIVLHLNVMADGKKLRDYPAIIKETQYHPTTDQILHIDFSRISLTEEIEVKVPVVVQGEALGVKQDGGSLDHHLRELDVVCLPTSIPQHFEVDVSELKIHDAIYVKDLALPEGVKTHHDPEAVVVSVVPPMKEEEETPSEEGAPEEPEVTKEKSKEDAPKEDSGEKEEKAEG